jgi:preprotein translocase subunit YajC
MDTAQTAQNGSILGALLWPLLLVALFWFLLIRPARRRQALQRAVTESLTVGAAVVTTSGLHGTIVGLDERTVRLEIAQGVVVTYARPAIMEVTSG